MPVYAFLIAGLKTMKEATLRDVDDSINRIDFYPGIAAAVFYGLTSGSMSFMNKVP